ncbi:MAG: tetratricopeptide repeat protein [Ignavibacteria bacterium]|nr:tetratricopeptide repeat protein [Ignavibacteria bacterium]
MKYRKIPQIPAFFALFLFAAFFAACSSFNYKTYNEEANKDIEDPEPNYDVTLDGNFQDFTSFMFIGNRIENFSTYFNTFFNASENFNDAYDDYATRVLANYSERQDSIFARPRLSQESIDKFNIAIQKASKVIQYHKSSQFMDRSVLLVGKSYYYLGDYLKAERKFGEFISRLKSSRYLDEALLYLAKTQLRLENEKPAIERLNSLIETSKDMSVVSESYQSLAEYYLNKKDYENSIKNFKKAIELSNDNSFKAQMQFLVASVTSKTDQKKAAIEYDKVMDYNASFDLEYLAKFNLAKSLVLSGRYAESNSLIEDLTIKYKDNNESLAQINYLKAVYFDERKDNKNAIKQYYEVIKEYPGSIASSDAAYKIGSYYEDKKNDYLRAFMYYRFSTEQNAGGTYNKPALSKTGIFKRYFELRSAIGGETINTDYDTEFKKKTSKVLIEGEDNGKPPKQNNNNGKGNGESGSGTSGFIERYSPADSLEVTDTIVTFQNLDSLNKVNEKKISDAKFELAELFLYDLNRTDSSEYYLLQSLNESTDYEFSAKVLFALSELARRIDDGPRSEEYLKKVIEFYPHSEVANSSRRLLNLSVLDEYSGDASDSLYSAAENSFVAKDYPTALVYFNEIISKYPSSARVDRAYYGAGWICENVLNQNDSAYYYYSALVKTTPNSQAAAIVMQKVTEYESFNKTNAPDSSLMKSPENETEPKIDGNNLDPEQLKKESEEQINNEGNVIEEIKKKGKEFEEAPKEPEINKEDAPTEIPTEIPGKNEDPSK